MHYTLQNKEYIKSLTKTKYNK